MQASPMYQGSGVMQDALEVCLQLLELHWTPNTTELLWSSLFLAKPLLQETKHLSTGIRVLSGLHICVLSGLHILYIILVHFIIFYTVSLQYPLKLKTQTGMSNSQVRV